MEIKNISGVVNVYNRMKLNSGKSKVAPAEKKTDKFYVAKDGGENEPIDALSGATITSRAVTGAVNTALGYFQNALGGSGNE